MTVPLDVFFFRTPHKILTILLIRRMTTLNFTYSVSICELTKPVVCGSVYTDLHVVVHRDDVMTTY